MRIALLSTSRRHQEAVLQALAAHAPATLHIHCLTDWPAAAPCGAQPTPWDCVFLLPATAGALLQTPGPASAAEQRWRSALLEGPVEWRVLYGSTAAQARAVLQALADHGLLPAGMQVPQPLPAGDASAATATDAPRLRYRNCEDCVEPGCERRLFSGLLGG